MYFLAKNFRQCSRSFMTIRSSAEGSLHPRQKRVPINCSRFTRYTSSCIHPEQMKRIIKERDAHMLCQFFDSDEYKNRVSSFLEKQSKLLSKETVSKIHNPNQTRIQHVLSCARPECPRKKSKAQKNSVLSAESADDKKSAKKAKKTTILEHLIKNKKVTDNLKCDVEPDTVTIQPILKPKKIVRTKTTIMPIFLKKMQLRNAKNDEKDEEDGRSILSVDNESVRSLDPNSAPVIHRSNLPSRGLKTMTPRKAPKKISTTLIPKKQTRNMNLKTYSQLLVTKPVKNTVYNMNSEGCLLSKKHEKKAPIKVEVLKTRIGDNKVQWPPTSSKRMENINLQKYTVDMLMSEVQKVERNDNLEKKNTIKQILNNTVRIAKPKGRELVFSNLFEQVKLGTMKKQQNMAAIHTIPQYNQSRAKTKSENVEKQQKFQTPESFTYKIVSRVKKCREKELKESFEVRSLQSQNRCFLKGSIKSQGSSAKPAEVESTKAKIVSNLARKPFIGNIVTSRRVQPVHIYGYHTPPKF